MTSRLADSAMLHHHDQIGTGNRAQPMRDHKTGPMLHQLRQTLLNQLFAVGVEIAGRFVQNQHFGVGQDGTGNRQTLPLAATETHTTFADHGLQTLWHAVDEFEGIRRFRCRSHLVTGGVAPGVGDVLANRSIEQKDILLDHPQQ